MATFNFKTTEDDRPGGGVYRIPGNGPTWQIRQSDYPDVNLAGMSDKNFFAAAVCLAGTKASVTSNEDQNISCNYAGGNAGKISYSFAGGIGEVSIIGAVNRKGSIEKYLGSSNSKKTSTGSMTYTLYMSRTAIE